MASVETLVYDETMQRAGWRHAESTRVEVCLQRLRAVAPRLARRQEGAA